MNDTLHTIYHLIIEGDMGGARQHVEDAIDQGVSAEATLKQALIPAMEKVGELFEEGEYFVPEMLISARAMQAALKVIGPHLVEENVGTIGKVVIGTVKGDMHDIGKNLVGMMLEGIGFEVVDLGTDVSAETFVEAARDADVDVVALSALLTTTLPGMFTTIEALESAGLRGRLKIMVGGAPVTAAYAAQIGADGYALDASQAASLAKSFVG
jgi:5-methyltetrahydrofolate--homocysteine methyltransferase